mmetsp:Transcript_852/g.1697  ORF Transcript_852/g.1697 Transcript_852/m.1697 type:complete len:216 (-) Transcript_852:106-753(-)
MPWSRPCCPGCRSATCRRNRGGTTKIAARGIAVQKATGPLVTAPVTAIITMSRDILASRALGADTRWGTRAGTTTVFSITPVALDMAKLRPASLALQLNLLSKYKVAIAYTPTGSITHTYVRAARRSHASSIAAHSILNGFSAPPFSAGSRVSGTSATAASAATPRARAIWYPASTLDSTGHTTSNGPRIIPPAWAAPRRVKRPGCSSATSPARE